MIAVSGREPPTTSVARVQAWCRARVPEAVRDRVRIECEVSGRDLTVVERHPASDPSMGPEWSRSPVARLRYLTSRGVWRLYWHGSDDSWHEYPDLPFARTVDELLDEIEQDPRALFWG
jgi:hypothetical protein